MYNAQDVIVSSDRHDRANGFFPSSESMTESSPYMIPRCRPDKARMCDAPLLLNADFKKIVFSGSGSASKESKASHRAAA